MVGLPFSKTVATAGAGLGREVPCGSWFRAAGEPPLPHSALVWTNWVDFSVCWTIIHRDCVWRSAAYYPGNPLRVFRGKAKAKKVKTWSVDAPANNDFMSEKTRKHSISTSILLSTQKQQSDCPGSESRKNLAFTIKDDEGGSSWRLSHKAQEGVP